RHLDDMVTLAPPLPYREALAEMGQVHALLVLQGDDLMRQIPAKIYEYFRAGRPLMALTRPEGETGQLLLREGYGHVVPLGDAESIARHLPGFLAAVRAGAAPVMTRNQAARFERRTVVGQLAGVFDTLIAQEGA
ncbi:MAG: hypothetical protein H7831_18995, partial [Magnetococcus sp. WYHC-3]